MSEDVGSGEEEANPVRRTLDLLVFAPVGVVMTVLEDLPGLIAKGRQRVENEISNARVVGEFVVTQGQREVTQRVGQLWHRDDTGSAPDAASPPPDAASGEPAATSGPAASSDVAAPPPPSPPAAPKPEADPADAALVESALAGYDTLSASQVVRRLESLGAEELHAVHRHEASHRHRRTILNRTNQLLDQSGPDPASAG